MNANHIDAGTYQGRGTIDGHRADVDLHATRAVDIDHDGFALSADIEWTGRASLLDPPSFAMLEFSGPVEVTVASRTAVATIVDATPGTGFIYLCGRGEPPFATTRPRLPECGFRPHRGRT